MAYEQKNGQITVWKNDYYTKGGNQPYAKGKGKDLNGVEVEITLWIPKSDKIKGFNLTISEPYKKEEPSPKPDVPQSPTESPEDDLPF